LALAKIGLLRVETVEDSQRAIDQLTQCVNSLIDLSGAGTNNLPDALLSEGKLINGTPYKVGEVVAIQHRLGRAFKGFICTNGLTVRLSRKQRDPSVQIDVVVEGYELIQRQIVGPTAVTTVTFNKDIDGDLDLAYKFLGFVEDDVVGTYGIRLRPNGVTTGAETTSIFSINGGAVGSGADPAMSLAFIDGTQAGASGTIFEAYFTAASGTIRNFRSVSGGGDTTVDSNNASFAGAWNNTVDKVISFDIFAQNASGIGPGSWFELYRSFPLEKSINALVF
jgi:hypothetical protein